jgi:glyoxylase-like metal-dependent hydrolase (beta-lactamase superfamily II)
MARAAEFQPLTETVAIWHALDLAIRTELFSTALRTEKGIIAIDPIPLTKAAQFEFESFGRASAIAVTNCNHERAARDFAKCYSAPIFAPKELGDGRDLSGLTSVHEVSTIAVDGAGPGEFALYDARDGGTLIVGDALINFEPYGFALLPEKYCTNRKRMIGSLRQLLDLEFVRLLFAHGTPVTTRAKSRLDLLLKEGK